jgi:hypothetical protein
LVGSSEAKKVPGRVSFFPQDLCVVVLNSTHRETPKNVIKRNRENRFGIFCRFFWVKKLKAFRHDLFVKRFLWCFLNSHRKETPKNAIKQKKSRKNNKEIFVDFLRIFWDKASDFFQNRVFELPSPRNVQKRTKKKVKKKKVGLVGSSKVN